MAYRFKLQEPLAQGVRRVALEQIDIAEEKLAAKDDVPTAIHDARRCLKRLRSLVRLVRPALGEVAYRREAERVAGTGRLLSGERDVHVMRQTAAKLESRFGPLPGGGKRLQTLLAASAAAAQANAGTDARRQALQRLRQTRKFFAGRALDGITFAPIAEGLERCYRKGRKAFRSAYRKPADEAFHVWRKSVQQHWRHMQLVSRAWPEALSARAGEAKELSRLLGEDHDHAVLLAHISQASGSQAAAPSLTGEDIAALTSLCRSCQAEIRALAEPHGARLFAESAGELRERIEAYWSSACSLAQSAPPEEPAVAAKTPAAKRKRLRTRR
jgi:CHAD domain-containing protein